MIQKYKTLKKEITDHDHDNITTPEFNKLATEIFKAKLKQADLVTKTEFDTKLQNLNKKNYLKLKKHLLIENELKKNLKTFDLSYFRGKIHFEEDGTQNH